MKISIDYTSYEILFKPVEYFAITKDNHLIMNDYTINFEKEIEAIYDTYLPDKKFYRIGGWTDPKYYEMIKNKYPKAFINHEKRVNFGKQVARERGVEIKNRITSAGDAYRELKIKINDISPNTIIDKILYAENIFIEIYSKMEKIPPEKFKISWSKYKREADRLQETIFLSQQIIKTIPETTTIKTFGLENQSYLNYTNIAFIATFPNNKEIEAYIYHNYGKPGKNKLTTLIKTQDIENIQTKLQKYKPKTTTQTITIDQENINNQELIQTLHTILSTLENN